MAAIDDLNAEIQALTTSVSTLTTSVNALVASAGTGNDAAISAAVDQLKTVQSNLDALNATIPQQPVSQ